MFFNLGVLLLSALAGGIAALLIPKPNPARFQMLLVFSGAFLFGITIVHILPLIFIESENPATLGLLMLAGFFLQHLLEYFSAGTGHGHMHIHDAGHRHSKMSAMVVLFALSVHAFLEGTLLANPEPSFISHNTSTLLAGIALHKLPAAFALSALLTCYLSSTRLILTLIVIFSLMSPAGLLSSTIIFSNSIVPPSFFAMLFALVGGNFLHISTTIVFESSPEHHFNFQKLGLALLGAGLAALIEVLA